MSAVLLAAAVLVAGLAVVAAAAALAATRSATVALPVLLDLLLAAGLLRLAADPGAAELGTAAALVVVRRIASAGLARH